MKVPAFKDISELRQPAMPQLLLPEETSLVRWGQPVDFAWYQPKVGPDPTAFRLEIEYAADPRLFHRVIEVPYKRRLTEIKGYKLPEQLCELIAGTEAIRCSVTARHYNLSSPKVCRIFLSEGIAVL